MMLGWRTVLQAALVVLLAACAAQPPATRPEKIDGPSIVPSRPARPLMWPPAMPATSPAA